VSQCIRKWAVNNSLEVPQSIFVLECGGGRKQVKQLIALQMMVVEETGAQLVPTGRVDIAQATNLNVLRVVALVSTTTTQ